MAMGLLERVAAARSPRQMSRSDGPFDPADSWFGFGGRSYFGTPTTSYGNSKAETTESDFQSLVQSAYKANSVIWACERTRLSVFSEARFQFRQVRDGRLGDYFGKPELSLLEQPWTNGTTGDLLTRMLQDADFAGNAYFTRRGSRLRRLRPDWVSIVMGSQDDPDMTPDDIDAELVAYVYWPGGPMAGPLAAADPVILLPDEVAHFAPTPDPVAHYRGMSWLSPVIREIQADSAATEHKLAFFRNGATPQVVVSFDKDVKEESLQRFAAKMNAAHQGASNAYRTIYVGGGADVTVVGSDLKQLDFKATQGAGETRIAAAAGVHPTVVGLSEGMQGSSLNAGNFGQTRRLLSEVTLATLWRNAAASMSTLVPPPQGSELACDTRDVAFLREDQKDAAEIQQTKAATIRTYIDAGYEPDSVVAAVDADDRTLLVHTGLFSVQLQPAGSNPAPGDAGPKAQAARATELDWDDDPIGELDEDSRALLEAIDELAGIRRARTFNPDLHPRNPKGAAGGGRFRSMVDRLKDAIQAHAGGGGEGHPFDGFDREQLRRVAKTRGIALKRGEDRDSIAAKILAELAGPAGEPAEPTPKPKTAAPKRKPVKAVPTREPAASAKPAVPEFAQPYHRNLDGIEDLAASVEDRRPPQSVRALTGGVSAETELVELADGRKVVRKTAGNPAAEHAASMIGRALGLPVPRVYRDSPAHVYMDYVDNAETLDQLRARATMRARRAREAALQSDDGKRIALLDMLIANADRNDGNWMIADGGALVPIDHGHAFASPVVGDVGRIRPKPIAVGPFSQAVFDGGGRWVDHDFTPADIQEARRRLESLRPDFAHIDRERWLDYGLAVLDQLETTAKGKRNLLADTVA